MANNKDNKAFEMMTAVADKTNVNIIPKESKKTTNTKLIHNALLAAGMTPAYGNVADLADATLYAIEGEFGDDGWSLASAMPIIGQMVASKKALKVAKESGQETVKLYRGISGIDDAQTMVKGKNVVGKFSETFDQLTAPGKNIARETNRKVINSIRGPVGPVVTTVPKNVNVDNLLFTSWKKNTSMLYTLPKSYKKGTPSMLLEFEVPVSYINKHARNAFGISLSRTGQGWGTKVFKKGANMSYPELLFTEGLPKHFLTKVHKW